MCFTKDKQPIVGQMKERKGQFIASGYSGHGMVRAFSCGRHVAEQLLGLTLSCPEIDEVFSPERIYS
jgi:glycine/D-amino acid oxidase-like deaminating enzyme